MERGAGDEWARRSLFILCPRWGGRMCSGKGVAGARLPRKGGSLAQDPSDLRNAF